MTSLFSLIRWAPGLRPRRCAASRCAKSRSRRRSGMSSWRLRISTSTCFAVNSSKWCQKDRASQSSPRRGTRPWGSHAGSRWELPASVEPISGHMRRFLTNSDSRLSTRAPSRRKIRSATMPLLTALRSSVCWDGLAGRGHVRGSCRGWGQPISPGRQRAAVAAPVSVVSGEAREVLKRELSPSTGQIVDGQISY
jgi:hypothetical protein